MKRMRHRWVIAVAPLALLVPAFTDATDATAAVKAGRAEPTTATVQMIHFTFDPPTLTIPAGSTVTWTYDESATDPQPGCESPEFHLVPAVNCPGHSTTAVDLGADGAPLWDSGVHRAEGFPYSHTFTTPGTYSYYCLVHGGPHPNNPLTQMNGVIIVTAAAASAAADAGTPGAAEASAPAATQAAGANHSAGELPVTGGTGPTALAAVLVLFGLAVVGVRRRAR